MISSIATKLGSNKNISKAVVYHHKSSQSWSSAAQTEAHTASIMHSMKSWDKPIKQAGIVSNQKTLAEKHNDWNTNHYNSNCRKLIDCLPSLVALSSTIQE